MRGLRPTPQNHHMIKPILVLHIAAGSVALLSMWVPMVSRKGGALHRRSGWVFVTAMAVVSITALVLAGARLLFDPRPAARDAGFFLLSLSVLTANSVSSGVRVLRARQRTAAHVHWWDIGLLTVLSAGSVALGGYGVWRARPLFLIFAVIGLINGVQGLRYWLRPASSPMQWWFAHMNNMLGGCVATLTAFLVNTTGMFGISPYAAWLGPSLVGTPVIAIWTGYYKRRFAARKTIVQSLALTATQASG
jgi:uncharacterized membrane protein